MSHSAKRCSAPTSSLPAVGHSVIYGPVLAAAAAAAARRAGRARSLARSLAAKEEGGVFREVARSDSFPRTVQAAVRERACERQKGWRVRAAGKGERKARERRRESDRLTAEGTDRACTARVAKSIKDCFIDLTVRAR